MKLLSVRTLVMMPRTNENPGKLREIHNLPVNVRAIAPPLVAAARSGMQEPKVRLD